MRSILMTYHRWMIRKDLPQVMDIEEASFVEPWGEQHLLHTLRARNAIGFVAEHRERVVGYIIYELCPDHFHILRMAVGPLYRRQGVASGMVHRLTNKLSPDRRTGVRLETCETNLQAQLFYRSLGFRAIRVERDHYLNGESAYVMEYRK